MQTVPVNPAPVSDANANAAEAADGAVTPTPKPDEDFAQRFAGLSKRERELRTQQRQFEEQRQKAQRDDQEYEEYRKTRENAKRNPLAYLKTLGLTYEDLTDSVVNDDKPTTDQELRLLREEVEAERKARAEAQQKAEDEEIERQRSGFLDSIKSHVKTYSDKYELIEAQGAEELVFGVVEQYYHEYTKLPDLDEACRHVEEHLEAEARRLIGLKKFAAPKKEGELSDDKGQPGQRPATQKITLTNDGTAAPTGASFGNLPREKSIERSAAMLRWN